MYPAEELNDLARRKAALRSRISSTRLRCAAAAGEVARPIAWIDRFVAQWRRISPLAKLAALPLGFLLRRTLVGRGAKKSSLVTRTFKLLPTLLGAVRIFAARR